jgi:hypothetical protein
MCAQRTTSCDGDCVSPWHPDVYICRCLRQRNRHHNHLFTSTPQGLPSLSIFSTNQKHPDYVLPGLRHHLRRSISRPSCRCSSPQSRVGLQPLHHHRHAWQWHSPRPIRGIPHHERQHPYLNSAPGTDAIVRHIHNTLDDNPDECFVLEGYSLGATATCDALPRLTGDSFRAVKAVFLIGNPERRAGLDSNVDSVGGGSTKNSNGILSSRGGIPEDWVSKTMDVCEFVSRSVVIDQVIYRHTC